MAAVAAVAAAEVLIAQEVSNQIIGQLVAALLQAVLGPELEELQEVSNAAFVKGGLATSVLGGTRALDPASIIDAYIKGHIEHDKAINEMALNGQNPDHFNILEATAGEPPPFELLAEAWRRAIIKQSGDETSLEQGIRESRLKNKWIPILEKLQFRLPDPGVLIEGWLRSVIEPEAALDGLYKNGIDKDTATLMFKAAGRPPGPQELITLMLRGIIPETGRGADVLSLEQGFLETDLKDKWWPVWKELAVYLPPPRTITALLRAGSISEATAKDLFKKSGLPDDLAAAYIADASHQKTLATKELAVGTVVNMYQAKELSRDQATGFITSRGYTADDAAFLLDYADFELVKKQVDALVSRIRTLYVGHKIVKQAAVDALSNVGMASEVISNLLSVWDQEANASPTLLTAVQIADAAKEKLLDPNAAIDELQGRGYDLRDAYLVLALHKVDLTGVPVPAGVLSPP